MAKVIKLDEKNMINNIEFLAEELKNGKIFILPTSTIYGICGNALNENTVKKIYKIKKRQYNKPLIVLVNNKKMLNNITYGLNNIEEKIISKFWPGPLTLILKKKNIVPNIVTSNGDSVGIRVDSNKIVNSLIEKSNVPIVAPSANISNKDNITCIDDIEEEIFDLVDYIIDGGKLKDTQESTIIKVNNEQIQVIREGKIKKNELII